MREYLDCLNKYAVFSGRASRREYWMFHVVNVFASAVVGFLAGVLARRLSMPSLGCAVVCGYSLAVFLPSLAVAVRRLHDLGKSGWWLLMGLVPFVGMIVLLIFFCLPGQEGDNRFGCHPFTAVRETEQTDQVAATSLSPAVAGGVGLLAFLLGAAYLHGMLGVACFDPVFGRDAAFFAPYHVLLMGLMCATSGLAMKRSFPVRSRLWGCIWTLGVLEVAFMVHLVVAYAYYGSGMSFMACVRGFLGRCAIMLILMGVAWCLVQTVTIVLFGVSLVRQRLERAGLSLSWYRGNGQRLVYWTGLLGLLVYELALLLVFVNRGWWGRL